MTSSQHSPPRASIHQIGPALLGAFSFACADVLIKDLEDFLRRQREGGAEG